MLPVASASIPWQIVLAIIAFNIVAGIISKNKQKPGKAGPKPGPRPEDARRRAEAMRQRREEAHAEARAEAERKTAARQASEREAARRGAAAEKAAGNRNDEGGDAGDEPDAGPEAGRRSGNILEQLARELGLELPVPQRPAPRKDSRPGTAGRIPAESARSQAAGRIPAESAGSHADGRARAETPETSGAYASAVEPVRRDIVSEPDPFAAASVRSRRPVPAPAAGPLRSRPLVGRDDLSDPMALRKAFILKTILDEPVSLRPDL